MNELTFDDYAQKHLTQAERDALDKLWGQYTQEELDAYDKKWEAMFARVKQHLHEDPTGPVGMQLCQAWGELVNEMYGEHHDLAQRVWQAFQVGAKPTDHMAYYDQAVIDFIDKGYQHYLKTQKENQ